MRRSLTALLWGTLSMAVLAVRLGAEPGKWVAMNTDVLGLEASDICDWQLVALTFSGGKAYAYGRFVIPDSRKDQYEHAFMFENKWMVRGVAEWDGTRWTLLGAAMSMKNNHPASSVRGTLAHGPDGALYVGGNIIAIGSEPTSGVARWDGQRWQALGAGIKGDVMALAFDASGMLYAGGEFMNAGGQMANNIARWDGKQWTPLGPGLGRVRALAVGPDGALYAGGAFTRVGGMEVSCVVKWDGAQWSDVGGGLHTEAPSQRGEASSNSSRRSEKGDDKPRRNPVVHALTVDPSGHLYAAGHFLWAGDVEVRHVARWDGARWSPLGDNSLDPDAYVDICALATDMAGNVFIGGQFGAITKTDQEWWDTDRNAYGLAKWDGTKWWSFEYAIRAVVTVLAMDPEGLPYVDFRYARDRERSEPGLMPLGPQKWKEGRWGPAFVSPETLQARNDQGINGPISSMLVDPLGNLYVGGRFTKVGGVDMRNLIRSEKGEWTLFNPVTIIEEKQPIRTNISGLLYDHIWGHIYALGGRMGYEVLSCWDGQQWMELTRAGGNALASDSSGNLYLGQGSGIHMWDGAQWTVVENRLDGNVLALALDRNDHLYAAGSFKHVNGMEANHVAKWDGRQWSALGRGMGGGSIHSTIHRSGHSDESRTVRTNTSVGTLVFDAQGLLYAGGDFHTAGVMRAMHIARWDGQDWSNLGEGLSTPHRNLWGQHYFAESDVRAIVFDGAGSMFVGGWFTHSGDNEVNHIARWDGRRWSALADGGGVTGTDDHMHPITLRVSVSALAFDAAGDLYVGGYFSHAGNTLSPHFAKYRLRGGHDGDPSAAAEKGSHVPAVD